VILVSDNGASGDGGPGGSVNEMLFANGIPDNIQANLAMLDELGGTKTYNHYPNGWAMAFNTPFKMTHHPPAARRGNAIAGRHQQVALPTVSMQTEVWVSSPETAAGGSMTPGTRQDRL
jgi:hypothetical protein